MSIRGIDTQIMITRATELVREASSIQRHPETSQEHLAAQTKVDTQLDQSRVIATTESEMDNVRTDVEEEGSGATGGDGSRREEEESEDELNPDLMVPPSDRDQIIDITI